MKKFFLAVFLMYFISFCFYTAIFYYQMSPVEKPADLIVLDEVFTIKEGESLAQIAQRLEDGDLIRSAPAFKFYLLITGKAGNIIPGQYDLSNQISARRIAKEITILKVLEDVAITIPEGWTMQKINDVLVKRGVLIGDSLMDSRLGDIKEWKHLGLPTEANLEGFLFPDTYHFKSNSSISEVMSKFVANFNDKLSLLKLSSETDQINLNGFSLYEAVTVASLIEAEVPFKEDKVKVADIIYKRMNVEMPIQIDASLIYEKCFIKMVKDCRTLFKSDLRKDSPYNTYTRRGLPAGPIGNPGLASLKAALWPEKTNYWYYVSDQKTRKTIFSENLDQHNIAIRKYLSN